MKVSRIRHPMKQSSKRKVKNPITLGVELETYSIALPENRICRELHFPKRSAVEKGEKFVRDWSIGSEYNSRPFTTVREALFLLKSGLRKYSRFRITGEEEDRHVIFPVGGWIDRFAGCHIHIGLGKHGVDYPQAAKLSSYLHDHIPFLIVLTANSSVWREKITNNASNRLLRGSETYFKITKRGRLYKQPRHELTFNRENRLKPPTLEIRVCDSSIPEYIAAALCVCRAVAMRWAKGVPILNVSTHANYLKAREKASHYGVKSKLVWTNHWMDVSSYVDLFFRKYEPELDQMDIPDEVLRVFKYLKKGWNQAELLKLAAQKCQRRHYPTWQRQFAKKYAVAIDALLDGNSFEHFAQLLGVKLPSIERSWLGRKEANW